MTIKINLPSIEEQKRIVEKTKKNVVLKRKHRTSVELSQDVNEFLENEAERHQIPPSEMLRIIIDEAKKNSINLNKYKRKLRNITLFQEHIDTLEKLGLDLIPDGWKGKRGVNRGQVAEILIREYWHKKIQEKGRAAGGLFLRQFEFLKKIMGESDETIIQTAIADLYQFRFQTFIHQNVKDLCKIDDDIKRRIAMKDLLIYLYADQGDLMAVKNNLNYLDVPPHGQNWSMANVRQVFKDLNITLTPSPS